MPYFSNFPKTFYSFGDGKVALAQNLTTYAEVVDEIKNNGAFYTKYHIVTGERPDQVAFKLYKDADLYWTLFLINDNLREKGWPLDQFELLEKAKKDFPDYVIHTHDQIFDKIKVGETIMCNRSGLRADVVYRNLKLGDITVTNLRKLQGEEYIPVAFSTNDIVEGDLITSVNTNETITAEYFTPEHLAARYHAIDGELIDYLPFTSEGEGQVRVTNLDYYIAENDKLKEINVLKPSTISKVVTAFNDAVRS
jgi:hypothetical protein